MISEPVVTPPSVGEKVTFEVQLAPRPSPAKNRQGEAAQIRNASVVSGLCLRFARQT